MDRPSLFLEDCMATVQPPSSPIDTSVSWFGAHFHALKIHLPLPLPVDQLEKNKQTNNKNCCT